MYTTLNKIRQRHPCTYGWEKLLRHLGKTAADDEPLSIMTVLESNGIEDTIWCLRAVDGYDRERQLFAVRCVRRFQHLATDQRSLQALDVAEMFSKGLVDQDRLDEAVLASWDAAVEMDIAVETDELEGTTRPGSFELARTTVAWAVWQASSTFVCPWAVWSAATSAAKAAELLAEREKAREAELAYQAKLFAEIFSPERKD